MAYGEYEVAFRGRYLGVPIANIVHISGPLPYDTFASGLLIDLTDTRDITPTYLAMATSTYELLQVVVAGIGRTGRKTREYVFQPGDFNNGTRSASGDDNDSMMSVRATLYTALPGRRHRGHLNSMPGRDADTDGQSWDNAAAGILDGVDAFLQALKDNYADRNTSGEWGVWSKRDAQQAADDDAGHHAITDWLLRPEVRRLRHRRSYSRPSRHG